MRSLPLAFNNTERMRGTLKVATATILRWRRLLMRRSGPAILMYHRIAQERFDPWGLAVSRERFVDQLDWLARNRTILTLHQFAVQHRERCLPSDAIAVTFDDGYACNADVAGPLLERMGICATIFLPVELIEHRRDYWWHELERIVLCHRGPTLCINEIAFELGERMATDRDWLPHAPPKTPRQRAYLALWQELHAMRPAVLNDTMTKLRSQSDCGPRAEVRPRPMSAEQVRALPSSVIEFGSHALTHASLPSLASDEKAREIQQSTVKCEQLTGSKPLTFAYPFGDFDEECEKLVCAAGFTCACTTVQQSLNPNSRLFALPRIQVGDWPVERFSRIIGVR